MLLLFACVETLEPPPPPAADAFPPSVLPAMELVDLDGEPLPMPSGGVLVSIWASWCPPCHDEFPHLQDLHDQGVPLLTLSVDVPARRAEVEAAMEPYSFPVSHHHDAAALFHIKAIPSNVLYDAEGRVLWSAVEEFNPDDAALLAALETL
jgi:thiol-disulfide isomerase/thioredoxin